MSTEEVNSPPFFFFSQQGHPHPLGVINSLIMWPLFIGTSYVPGIMAGTKTTAVTGQTLPCSLGVYVPLRMTDYQQQVRSFQIVIAAVKEQGVWPDHRMTTGEMGMGEAFTSFPFSAHPATF